MERSGWRDGWKDLPSAEPQSGGEPALAVSVFGAFSASWRGKPIEIKLRKGAAVLGYLCMQENLTARRDRLAFLLVERERQQFGAHLAAANIDLVAPRLSQTPDSTASRQPSRPSASTSDSTDIDFKRVVGATDEGRIDDALFAVERLPETLLEGMEELDEEFRMWLLPTRQALHNRLERVLSAQLNDSAATGAVEGAWSPARCCGSIRPTRRRCITKCMRLRSAATSSARCASTAGSRPCSPPTTT